MNRIEQAHCLALMKWCKLQEPNYPDLALLIHIPNEGKRSKVAGGIMKAMGLKAGVPDYFLPVARHGFHGFWFEMKAPGQKPTESQFQWIKTLQGQGFHTRWFDDWGAASSTLLSYLRGVNEVAHTEMETTGDEKALHCKKGVRCRSTPR